jgi:uncharacterized phage-associated protein
MSVSHPLPAIDPRGFDRPTATPSVFAVAAWFIARAAAAERGLPPLKLHALLFLAQGLFARNTGGRMLMPGVFVADERGPIEPNLEAVAANGWHPCDGAGGLTAAVERFLEVVWERYGGVAASDLVRAVSRLPVYTAALACGVGTPIGNTALREDVGNGAPTAAPATVTSPAKSLRTQDGRKVRVSAWQPVAARGVEQTRRARADVAPEGAGSDRCPRR